MREISRVLGIIPARGGSKGVPGKNIRLVNDKPLIDYAIQSALDSKKLTTLLVSTDCNDISQVATECGAWVPFLRPESLAKDDTPDQPVIEHALNWMKRCGDEPYDAVVYLRPTTPFKSGALIDQVIMCLQENSDFDSVRTVTRSEGIFHPYWMYKNSGDGMMESFISGVEFKDYYRRQLLPECFRLNGLVDAIRVSSLTPEGSLYGDKIGMIETDVSIELDIDTEFDLELCEFLMQKRESIGQNDNEA